MADNQFKIENYLANSFILIEGKKNANNFYIIRSGRVKLAKANPVVAEEPYSILGPGDFFGVISCMSGRPRIETSQAIDNVSLISIEKDRFGLLIQRNPTIAMKIIRFFSRKLRLFDHAIANISLSDSMHENPAQLFHIGEHHLKKKAMRHAIYVFQRYLQYCPNGENVDKAIEILQRMKAPLKVEDSYNSTSMNRTYTDKSIIFSECEPGNELFIIQSGKVKISKIVSDEVLLAVLKQGDIFGEMALLDNKPRSASAVSFGDTQVLAINKQNFESIVQQQPQMATRLIQLLSARIWTAYRQLDNLMISNDIGRMYDALLIQAEKHWVPIEPKTNYNFEIGPTELINMVGLPPDKGDVIFNTMLDDKNMAIENGKIICLDLYELEKTVKFYKKQTSMEKKREESRFKNY